MKYAYIQTYQKYEYMHSNNKCQVQDSDQLLVWRREMRKRKNIEGALTTLSVERRVYGCSCEINCYTF